MIRSICIPFFTIGIVGEGKGWRAVDSFRTNFKPLFKKSCSFGTTDHFLWDTQYTYSDHGGLIYADMHVMKSIRISRIEMIMMMMN